jgi:hypothetical protein
VPRLWNGYKLDEVDLLAEIQFHMVEVPEDAVEFALSSFLQNLHHKSPQLSPCQVTSMVVFVKVALELVPDDLRELQFLLSDVS